MISSPPPCGEGIGVGVGRERARIDDILKVVLAENYLPTPHPTLPHKGGGNHAAAEIPNSTSALR